MCVCEGARRTGIRGGVVGDASMLLVVVVACVRVVGGDEVVINVVSP